MATQNQIQASRQNIKKAQAKWKSMTKRQRALAQPEGRNRKKPGSTGEGRYYHIIVRPKSQFTSFRCHDVGREGHTQRLAGHRGSGSWATHAWLISKEDAHAEDGKLVIDSPKVKEILGDLRGPIEQQKGDIFKAKPRKNVPEKDKPTPAQKKAWSENIKKAQQVHRKNS
ncbi:MAG TPA: hypothetical protein VIT68_04595 [Candidatus Gracilibacteria bacterium]